MRISRKRRTLLAGPPTDNSICEQIQPLHQHFIELALSGDGTLIMNMTVPDQMISLSRMVRRRLGRFATGGALLLALLMMLPGQLQAQGKDPALDLYYLATAAYNRKLYPAAIGGFQEFLQKHANHAKADQARQGLALSFYAQKQYAQAIPHLGTLLTRPNLPKEISRDRIILLQGQCLLRSGQKDQARAHFIKEEGKLQNPAYKASALAAICDICFGKQEWALVDTWTAKLVQAKLTPDQMARGLYQQGFAHYQLKKYEQAAGILEKVTPLTANAIWKTRSSYLLGECYTIVKNHEKAEPAFVAALPGLEGPDKTECHYRLGVTRFILKQWAPAAEQFEAFLKEEPGTRAKDQKKENPYIKESQLYIGRCLLEQGEFKKAQNRLAGLINVDSPLGAKANLWFARVFSRPEKPNYDQAAAALEPAVKKYQKFAPINDDLRFDYANALMSRNNPDWKTSAQALGQINGEVFGQFAEVLAQRATCYHKLKDYNTSLTLANEYLAKFKDHGMAGDTRFLRAENMFLLNQLAPAIKAYEEFQVVNKDHPNTLAGAFRVAQIYHHQEQWDQSLAAANPLLAKKPEGPLFAQLAFLVGNCYFRKEQWKECLAPLEAFVATRVQKKNPNSQQVTADPNVDTALIQLAVACDRTEDSIKALEHLETLTRFYPTPTPHLPLALAEQGRLAYESGDLKLARAALERFLSEAKLNKEPFKSGAPPQRLRVNYFLGWVNATEKKHEPAALHFGVVSKDPKHALAADAALQQGLAYVHLEEFAQAAVLFPEILKRYPQHEKLQRVTYYAGLSLARQEKWKPAAGHLSKVADTWPDSEFADQALYEWAWCERKQKREAEAVKLYERFLGKYKESSFVVKVQSELAELNLKSGAQDMVIERLTKALASVKDDALRESLRYQLASAHYSKGEYEKSAGMFEQLLSDYPKSKLKASMCFQAGESRHKLKETVTARRHFAEGMKVGDLQPVIAESMMMRLAEMQSATADHATARKTYQDFIGRFPESKWKRNAQFGLAWSLENSDKPNEAIQHYAPLLDPKATIDLWTVRARFQTGECYFNMQKYEQAVKEFLNVEIQYKKYPAWQAKGILEIGRVLLAQNKREEAKQRFKDVIIRYPKEKAAIVARQYLDQLRVNG